MSSDIKNNNDLYHSFVKEIKEQIKAVQQRTVLSVNRELILLYWEIGNNILARQENVGWGSKIIS